MSKLTEDNLWQVIADASWKSDHDYKRIGTMWSLRPIDEVVQIAEFINSKRDDLCNKYEDAWLGNDGGEGIQVSDDGWNDLTADIVGRGKEFYEGITIKKMQEMAIEMDYTENFAYTLQYTPYWDM